MAERRGARRRPNGMRLSALVTLVAVSLTLVGCGSSEQPKPSTGHPEACPRVDPSRASAVAHTDLDGDGTPETVSYVASTSACAARVVSSVQGREGSVSLDDDLPVTPGTSFAITIPGRTGDVAVLRQDHPRGGFQVVLLAWSQGAGLTTLNVDDRPVFPFVATDVETTPLSASCIPDGFEITQARAHEPIGVAPAWDVYRTAYTVNGTTTTATPPAKIADNVLDKQLHTDFRALVRYQLFDNCRTAR